MICKKFSAQSFEFIKFCIVGIICTVIDASIFYCSHNFIGYKAALVAGFLTSITVNYILNIFWSFRRRPSLGNAVAVFAANCFNIFVVRMGLMWIFINYAYLSEDIAFIPTLIISILTNFLIVRYVIKRF